jgi:hypothetical protein
MLKKMLFISLFLSLLLSVNLYSSIRLETFEGGNVYEINKTYDLKWDFHEASSHFVNIYYWGIGDEEWTLLEENIPIHNKKYTWWIPFNMNKYFYMFKLVDAQTNQDLVSSGAYIRIKPPALLKRNNEDIVVDPNLGIVVYPNPATDRITISNNFQNVDNLDIIDLFGNTVHSFSLTSHSLEIDISTLTPGTYFIRGMADNQVISLRFVKY